MYNKCNVTATSDLKATKKGFGMNSNLLKARIIEKGFDIPEVAKRMNINRSSLYRKINKKHPMTINEAGELYKLLCLSHEDTIRIFFDFDVANTLHANDAEV